MSQTQHVFILGATGAVGSALARQLTQAGHKTFLAARNEQQLKELAKELGGVSHAVVDATNSAQVDAAVVQAKESFGRLDGLCNCVGSFALKPLHLVTDEEFEHDLAVNLKSSFYALRAAVRAMDRGEGGSVVLLSSAAARLGIPSHESIAAAKAGVVGLMLSAAATYASAKVRVNAVAPGLIETKLTRSITGNSAMAQASANMHPLHQFGDAPQVARAIAFLLAPENDFITGQVFGVDGGLASLRSRR